MALALHTLAGRLQRRHTVYVSSCAKDVFLRGRKLVLVLEDEERETPLEELRRFVLLGKPSFGSAVLYVLLREGVPVDWLDRFGRPLGLLTPVDHGDGAIRLEQARFSTSPADTLALARKVICAKIDNVADLIRRREPMPSGWKFTRARAEAAQSSTALRSAEAQAARLFFGLWHNWLDPFSWQGRRPYPAPDPVNALLSLGYGLLHNRLASALRHYGLDPRQGFFHVGRGRHCALASDLMEDMRFAVDSTVLKLIGTRQVKPEDFTMRGERCVLAGQDTFKLVFESFERMFAQEWACLEEGQNTRTCISLNERIDETAEGFCRHILGESQYQPFRRGLWATA